MTIPRDPEDRRRPVAMADVRQVTNGGAGVPQVNLAVQDEGNQNLPVFIPDQVVGEYGGEYGGAFAGAGGDIPPVFDLDFDDDIEHIMDLSDQEDDEDDSVWSDYSVWSDHTDLSLGSRYGSMSESEEEDDEGEDVRPGSPLDQEFPPGLPSAGPLVPTHGPAGPAVPADPPVSAGPVREEPTPSTSGLGSSTKRSREESPAAQQSAKRQRRDNGDVDDQQPSTSSGLCPFPVRGYWPAPYDDRDSDDSDSD